MRAPGALVVAGLLVAADAHATSCAEPADLFDLELVSRTEGGVAVSDLAVPAFRRRLSGTAGDYGLSLDGATFARVKIVSACPSSLPSECALLANEVCALPGINAECLDRCGARYACK
jgi:hypothetical protein